MLGSLGGEALSDMLGGMATDGGPGGGLIVLNNGRSAIGSQDLGQVLMLVDLDKKV